jgi:hypothetical protein
MRSKFGEATVWQMVHHIFTNTLFHHCRSVRDVLDWQMVRDIFTNTFASPLPFRPRRTGGWCIPFSPILWLICCHSVQDGLANGGPQIATLRRRSELATLYRVSRTPHTPNTHHTFTTSPSMDDSGRGMTIVRLQIIHHPPVRPGRNDGGEG